MAKYRTKLTSYDAIQFAGPVGRPVSMDWVFRQTGQYVVYGRDEAGYFMTIKTGVREYADSVEEYNEFLNVNEGNWIVALGNGALRILTEKQFARDLELVPERAER